MVKIFDGHKLYDERKYWALFLVPVHRVLKTLGIYYLFMLTNELRVTSIAVGMGAGCLDFQLVRTFNFNC